MIDRIPPFLQTFQVGIFVSHDRANGDLCQEIDDVTPETARDFPLGFDKCEKFFGELLFLHFFLGV